MEKKYTVFVSSTYKDLKVERQIVASALLEADCIPVGMEGFPAIGMDQMEYIKMMIDECDYYLVIVAGKYGSIDKASGKSYTELEFDYAKSKEIPIISIVHRDIGKLKSEDTETTTELKEALKKFRNKASTGLVRKDYIRSEELSGIVSNSVNKSIKLLPGTGWVRGDKAASVEMYQELERLRAQVKSSKSEPTLSIEEVKLLNDSIQETKGEPPQSISCADFLKKNIKLIASRGTEASMAVILSRRLKIDEGEAYYPLYYFRNILIALDLISLAEPKPSQNIRKIQEWNLTNKGKEVFREITLGREPLDLKSPEPNASPRPTKDQP